MKMRFGFVSNSSSSSFTCDHCKTTESGYDVGISEFEMVECDYGHICCVHHLSVEIDDPKVIEAFLEIHPTYRKYANGDMIGEISYHFPSEFCPMCNLEAIGMDDLVSYYELRFGLNQDEVLDDIKNTFNTYDNFIKAARDANDEG